MKTTRLIMLFVCALTLAACGDDDEPIVINHGGNDSPIDNGTSVNENRNTNGPTEAQTRYEFPKLKGGNNQIIVHKATLNDKSQISGINYCVEWDPSIHAQRWSCYQLYSSINYKSGDNVSRYSADNTGSLLPTCQYPNDQDLAEEYRFTTDPYKYSGYDHGHICPSADRLRATEANYQTFFITNMQPQRNVFNAGLWSDMEDQVRQWAGSMYSDTLYVCKGGTIDKDSNIKGYLGSNENRIPIPKYFFMALFSKKGSSYKALGFWVEHLDTDHKGDNLRQYAVSIDRLEELTGLDFFCNLPDDVENKAEATLVPSNWGLQ